MSEPRAIENFGKALAKLREFAAMPVVNDRDRAGIIQAFEFTFEQCWKAFRQIAAAQGIAVVSPRQSLEAALQLKLIDPAEETTWLEMLHDRNMTSHLYQMDVHWEDRAVGMGFE
ncbi:MAG: nucleotidyltransferase substrate binding protein [Planctomycetes bacterium]|nr:nucleotidyltransferase substrate binding protein [Planctomycetota bacterium]MBU4398911.1 nucleotidyltransferase substrate binding protein [Planctomycetota bacterium]MCG2684449.1 nucleotidyltransferase substrate binding protein [Planctomycetales bacterium]